MTDLAPTATANSVLVKLSARPDFTTIAAMPRGAARKTAAYNAIAATAAVSQAPAIALAEQLKSQGAVTGYETLVSPNMVVVDAATGKQKMVAAAFQALAGVKAVYSNNDGRVFGPKGVAPIHHADEPVRGFDDFGSFTPVAAPVTRPYGLDLIGAPEAWAQGADGHGLVYGSIDSGAEVTHEAIARHYRGTNADGSVDNDYNWFDPTGKKDAPYDYQGHGTHTIGTVTGDGVGVAPGAKFISAAGLQGGVDNTLRSLQWMLAPTKRDGSAPRPDLAPDVVGMSWWTGSPSEDLFQESMQDLRAAGIVPVKSAGNNGPGASSITSPGQYPEIYATAAVDSKGVAANFSSRGPAPFPAGSTTPKPDFAAPGVEVVSSITANRYGAMSGTSMAQPHMSGAVLDILSKYPQLTDAQLTEALKAGAVDKGDVGYDFTYGNGLINIPASLAAAAKLVGG